MDITVFRREESRYISHLVGATSLWEAVAFIPPTSYHAVGRSPEQAVAFLMQYMRKEGFDRQEIKTEHGAYALEGIL